MATKKKKTVKKKKKPISAKQKYENAYKKANSAAVAVKKRIAKQQKEYNKISKQMAHHVSGVGITRMRSLEKSIKANKVLQKKKIKAVDKAKANLKRYIKSTKTPAAYTKRIMAKIHKSKFYGKYSYIMPKSPRSNGSYVFIYASDESSPSETNVTANAVEKGRSLNTGAQVQPTTVSVTGYLGGDGSKSKMTDLKAQLRKLKRWQRITSTMVWHGDNVYKNAVITGVTPDFNHEPGTGGINIIAVTLTLQIGDFGDSNPKKKKKKTTDTGKKSVKSSGSKKKSGSSKKKKKKKRYIIAKRGYTYWYVSRKTHVSLAKVEKMNKYPARRIPIGAKIYY